MKQKRRSGLLTIVIFWAVVLSMLMQFSLSPNVAAANFIVELGGDVTCNNQTMCSATVWGDPPDSLDVTTGDTVYFYYNVTWADKRNRGSSDASFSFWFNTTYDGNEDQDGDIWNTTGDDEGNRSWLITVPNVSAGKTIYVVWTDAIEVNVTDCSDTDGIIDSILLY
ncbi:MAG: hypothetical protein ACE5QF_08175 [Thermoplasmata archaeon]